MTTHPDRIRPPLILKPMNKESERVRMVELSAEEARPVLRAFTGLVPTGVGLMKRSGVLDTGTPEELEGMAGRLPVFRIDPVT
jgi:hypothetical protein